MSLAVYSLLAAAPLLMAFSWARYRGMEYIIINYRWLLVLLFVVPLSTIYDGYCYLRSYWVFKFASAPHLHDKKVKLVQKQVEKWKEDGCPTKMCTARPGWQTMSFRVGKYKNTMRKIKVDLVDILQVDMEKRIVRLEPLVSIGQVTATLLPLGWTLPVVPELDDLTIGGMVNGAGIESSSHVYGLLQHCCLSFELVLGDGSLVKCSKEENADLFYSVPMSHGTLGFVVSAELRIVPCKSHVRVSYTPTMTLAETLKTFERESRNKENDFVECLAYSLDEAVVMTGRMVDNPDPAKINRIGVFYKPWFFRHVESFLKKRTCGEDFIPLRDYYHRHSKSLFWEMQDIVPFGNHLLFRYLLGWTMPPKVSFLKLTQSDAIKKLYEEHHFVQDMLVPMAALEDTLKFCDKQLGIYPLWLCPFILPNNPGMLHPKDPTLEEELMVDVGLYGTPANANYNPRQTTRSLEEMVRNVNGFQLLYADCFQTKQEFEEMFDHRLYHRMRETYNSAKAFPDVYGKVNKHART